MSVMSVRDVCDILDSLSGIWYVPCECVVCRVLVSSALSCECVVRLVIVPSALPCECNSAQYERVDTSCPVGE